jgi:16S rRNA pseudouridine516 synthase
MNLESILFSQGFGSRRACRALVVRGAVSIGATRCDDPYADFDPHDLEFVVDGVSWTYREKAYIALHKPPGHECSHAPQHHPSVYGLLPSPLVTRGVQCVGRLDEDTTGLLLLSDDGAFIHRLASPKRKVPKTYIATTRHPLDDAQIATLTGGVLLHGESKRSAALSARRRGEHLLELVVTEGKYHQVKRMVAAAGNRVEALHREAIGAYVLPANLRLGEWCWLGTAELARLDG